MESLSRLLIVLGLSLFVLGVVLHFLPSMPGLGRLPGDIRIERPGFRLYLPIASCLVLSALLSVALWIFSKWR